MNERDRQTWEELKADARGLGEDLAGESLEAAKEIMKPFMAIWHREMKSYGWDADSKLIELVEVMGKGYAEAKGLK
ncbi:hypothetical protein ACN20G_29785 (plasmid) [Streptomyces sp. BI20]|uniref:hypothetical protein n=1 Tax=Streptomyces sp. BI20 TaxID=3403460 RepID=UPI003C7345BF